VDMNKKRVTAKRKHKDTLFRDLFGEESAALELYNAIEGTNYGPEVKVAIVTLQDVLYAVMVNDLSFTIDDKLVVLIEHQSTINENMPLRMLEYIARVYEQLTDDKDKYRDGRMTIPRPEFYVLYNGEDERPDEEVLKLSDMFAKHGKENPINLELLVRVYNINKGRNPEIASRSATLNGYEVFIAKAREYEKTMPRENAIDRATEECIKEGILVNYLKKHRKAVRNMLTTEWKLKDALKVREMEGEARGEARGRTMGRAESMAIVAARLKAKGADINTIIELTDLSVDEILKL